MQRLFRSRLPPRLTIPQITRLSTQSSLSPLEIEDWYERFILCYPYGYISFAEFLIYLKQVNMFHGNQQKNPLSKVMIKQLFCTLDVNKDKQLNFEEFFRFNLLIHQQSNEEKLQFILNLYHREKKFYYTQFEVRNIFIYMFYLLNISKSMDDLSRRINAVLTHVNLNDPKSKICWNVLCISLLKYSSLREFLLADCLDEEDFITRL